MIWSLMCNVPQAMGLRSRFDGYDLERMGLLIIADRDVFTRRKAVGSESISRFIVIGPGAIAKGGSKKRTAAEKRDYIRHCRTCALSVAQGCRLMGLSRSTFYDAPAALLEDAEIVMQTWREVTAAA